MGFKPQKYNLTLRDLQNWLFRRKQTDEVGVPGHVDRSLGVDTLNEKYPGKQFHMMPYNATFMSDSGELKVYRIQEEEVIIVLDDFDALARDVQPDEQRPIQKWELEDNAAFDILFPPWDGRQWSNLGFFEGEWLYPTWLDDHWELKPQ